MTHNDKPRLTDDDIELIVEKVCDRLEKRLYLNVGKGVIGILWKIFLTGAIILAGYHLSHNIFLK